MNNCSHGSCCFPSCCCKKGVYLIRMSDPHKLCPVHYFELFSEQEQFECGYCRTCIKISTQILTFPPRSEHRCSSCQQEGIVNLNQGLCLTCLKKLCVKCLRFDENCYFLKCCGIICMTCWNISSCCDELCRSCMNYIKSFPVPNSLFYFCSSCLQPESLSFTQSLTLNHSFSLTVDPLEEKIRQEFQENRNIEFPPDFPTQSQALCEACQSVKSSQTLICGHKLCTSCSTMSKVCIVCEIVERRSHYNKISKSSSFLESEGYFSETQLNEANLVDSTVVSLCQKCGIRKNEFKLECSHLFCGICKPLGNPCCPFCYSLESQCPSCAQPGYTKHMMKCNHVGCGACQVSLVCFDCILRKLIKNKLFKCKLFSHQIIKKVQCCNRFTKKYITLRCQHFICNRCLKSCDIKFFDFLCQDCFERNPNHFCVACRQMVIFCTGDSKVYEKFCCNQAYQKEKHSTSIIKNFFGFRSR